MATGTPTISVKGLDAGKAFDRLGERVSKNLLRRSVRRGANVIRDGARDEAPTDEGSYRKGIKTKESGRARRQGKIEARVVATARHSHLIEHGTGPRIIKRAIVPVNPGDGWPDDGDDLIGGGLLQSGKFRIISNLDVGPMPANPVMRRAFEKHHREAISVMKAAIFKEIDIETKKQFAKAIRAEEHL